MISKTAETLTKTALITGTRVGAYLHPSISDENRPQVYRVLSAAKSVEPKSDWTTVLPVGAATGAGVAGSGAYVLDKIKKNNMVPEAAEAAAKAVPEYAFDKGPIKLTAKALGRMKQLGKILGGGAVLGGSIATYLKMRDDDQIDRARMDMLGTQGQY